jgi:hypothetical protein
MPAPPAIGMALPLAPDEPPVPVPPPADGVVFAALGDWDSSDEPPQATSTKAETTQAPTSAVLIVLTSHASPCSFRARLETVGFQAIGAM